MKRKYTRLVNVTEKWTSDMSEFKERTLSEKGVQVDSQDLRTQIQEITNLLNKKENKIRKTKKQLDASLKLLLAIKGRGIDVDDIYQTDIKQQSSHKIPKVPRLNLSQTRIEGEDDDLTYSGDSDHAEILT